MQGNTDILDAIHNIIKNDLEEFSKQLESELSQKYKEEFESKLREHRREVVLEVAEKIKVGHSFDPRDLSTNITIKL